MKKIKPIIVLIIVGLMLNYSDTLAQSRKDAIELNKWKASNLKVAKSSNPEDNCLSSGGTGPYDPTACLEKELFKLKDLKKLAKENTQISLIIDEEIKRVYSIQSNWRSLSSETKQERSSLYVKYTDLLKSNNGDYHKLLKQIGNDNKKLPSERQLAQSLYRFFDENNCTWNLCYQAEGCNFCGDELIFKFLFGSKNISTSPQGRTSTSK